VAAEPVRADRKYSTVDVDMNQNLPRDPQRRVAKPGLSLKALLLGFIVLLVFVLLTVSAILGFNQFRDHLVERQQVQAQDAATALGIALSSAVDGRDPAAVATFINALFDHGHYRQVIYTDTGGEILVDRVASDDVKAVPGWFRRLAELPDARADAEVIQGWQRLGQVSVEVDPASAYRALWTGVWRGALSFLLVGVLATLLAYFGLRLILRPLAQLEQQAEQLRAHRFWARVPVPRTRELGGVAIAANGMAQELEDLVAGQIRMIEDLRSQARHDPVTGLDNRASFDHRLRAECDSHEQPSGGCVALLSLSGFGDYNQKQGYDAGDALLKTAAERLRDYVSGHPGAFAARRQGGDFALFLPGTDAEEAQSRLEQLGDELMVDVVALGAETVAVQIGFVVPETPERSSDVMARADAALAQAYSVGAGTVVCGTNGTVASMGAQRWRAALTDALARERVRLAFQPTVQMDRQTLWFQQVLAQVEVDGVWTAASQFLPLVERYGLAVQLDQTVLRDALDHLRQHEEAVLCVVLSTASLADSAFCRQTLASLSATPQINRRLWLAVHENAIRSETRVLSDLIPRLREMGVRVMVDRFGIGGVSFDYLQRRVIDGVRIDRSFVRHLDQRPDAAFFIKSMAPIARSRDVHVFLAGIESEAEWHAAQHLGVDGAMGFYLARPSLSAIDPA